MFDKIHHILIDLLFALAGFFSGWWSYYFIKRRSPVVGISGPAFAHTMRNIDDLMINQNRQIAKLSQDLTEAQGRIEDLKSHNEFLERRVKALTEEVERLIGIISDKYGRDNREGTAE